MALGVPEPGQPQEKERICHDVSEMYETEHT